MARQTNGKQQTFTYVAPKATKVQLVGDFTHWDKSPINLRKAADGVWRAKLELEPGEHRYRFLVDGQWQDDPQCNLRAPNPYGSQDSIRRVP